MPSGGMRRSTRVFGVVKGVDGARVLRSGRLLWPKYDKRKIKNENGDGKPRRGSNLVGEWFGPIEKKSNGQGYCSMGDVWIDGAKLEQEMKVHSKNEVPGTMVKLTKSVTVDNSTDRIWGLVYTRKKRKRSSTQDFEIFDGSDNSKCSDDRMFGIRFTRRQQTKASDVNSAVEFAREAGSLDEPCSVVLTIVVESVSSIRNGSFACFLYSILRYMRKASLRLSKLSEFLLTEPIGSVYSSVGIRFYWGSPTPVRGGTCRIFGVSQCIPMFSVNISALTQCFMYMYSSRLLRKCWPNALVYSWNSEDKMVDSKFQQLTNSSEIAYSECKVTDIEFDNPVNKLVVHPSLRASKSAGRTSQNRNGLNYRSIQKRRSSVKTRSARNVSVIGAHKLHGALVSDFVSNRKNVISVPAGMSNTFRTSARSNSTGNFKEVNSRLKQEGDSSSCNTNILVIESDRCYRVDGAHVMLEFSASRDWLLVVKKDGLTRYTHKAHEVMRPCSCNRFTHAIIWKFDDDWKLEFPDRGDWLIFKDLYKECSDRNVLLDSDFKIIPVPGVHEITGYEDCTSGTFFRPDSYIKLNGDEVSRALAKKTANYDVDIEDETWLKEFNREYVAKMENHECIFADGFELMIDAFEKAFYCNPDYFSDDAAALSIFQDLGKKEVVEAIYSYWMKKRKQKRSSLLRVFQGHQPKKTSHIPKPALRKRRSMKRQPSQSGRGKQPIVLQALAAERDALEEQKLILKVQDAKAATESAILKRKRAQLKMENADLAAYKASMSLRIAEAAEVTKQPEVGAARLLDWKCRANDANCDLSITVTQSAT